MFRLDGKTAFITGAGSGIGEEIARVFAAQGATVVIGDVDEVSGRRVSDAVGGQARFRSADVSDSAAMREALEWTVAELGRLDILVNNAGIPLVGNVEETAEEDFERLMRVNVSGVFHGCKHAVAI